MAKKNLLKAAGMAIAAAGAIGLGTMTSPVGQEVVNAIQNTQTIQQGQQGKQARANQQQTTQQQVKVATSSIAYYLPWRPGDRLYGKLSMTPKEYGIYLMMTGKNKQNARKAKHYAKAWAV